MVFQSVEMVDIRLSTASGTLHVEPSSDAQAENKSGMRTPAEALSEIDFFSCWLRHSQVQHPSRSSSRPQRLVCLWKGSYK